MWTKGMTWEYDLSVCQWVYNTSLSITRNCGTYSASVFSFEMYKIVSSHKESKSLFWGFYFDFVCLGFYFILIFFLFFLGGGSVNLIPPSCFWQTHYTTSQSVNILSNSDGHKNLYPLGFFHIRTNTPHRAMIFLCKVCPHKETNER